MKIRHYYNSYKKSDDLKLIDGSKVAVIGGGPAGCFFSYFLIDLAKRIGLDIGVDIYEPKEFTRFGAAGCNHCGGVISESLVQILALEGINIPSTVVQRGIDSYVLHMDEGSVRIETPLQEKRTAAMHRGAGPRGAKEITWESFDAFLLKLNKEKGANIVKNRVKEIRFVNEKPQIITEQGMSERYDLLAGAVGINNKSIKLFEGLNIGFHQPQATKTFVCEFYLGQETVHEYFGCAMHVFMIDLPGLEFAALIPKGRHVSLALLGHDINEKLVASFLNSPSVRRCFPFDKNPSRSILCQCSPMINTQGAVQPYADRIVLLGDCAVTKLYKNGIGAAFNVAKAAVATSLLQGISSEAFKKHFEPVCMAINADNDVGKTLFRFSHLIQKNRMVKRGILRMVSKEQHRKGKLRFMSSVLWDTFTGSASYRSIFRRAFNPLLVINFLMELFVAVFITRPQESKTKRSMGANDIGRVYKDKQIIIKQGEKGDNLFVIRSGKVEVVQEKDGREIHIADLGEGEFFGEMALFEGEVRSTTVRALGEVSLLTIDKHAFLSRIQEDPTIAFRIIQKMSSRLRYVNKQFSESKLN